MWWSFAAIVGSVAGGIAVLVIFIGFIWVNLFRCKGLSNKTSETGSSDPSTLVEWNRTGQISSSGGAPEGLGARQFSLEELEQATKKFSEHNLVGDGSFGLVYKGLLLDGTIVAIKKRQEALKEDFIEEVNSLSAIRHRNIVTLIGYCLEGGLQMLVFEYVPNRSICSHLYGKFQTTKLEFKQRLSIAIGAAKGLAHLHSLSPPLVHGNFKTSNVLVDENFIAKVADAGLVRLLERIDDAGPSQASVRDIFLDPLVGKLGVLSEITDAYSFGVFVLELITGREVERLMAQGPSESLTKLIKFRWVPPTSIRSLDPSQSSQTPCSLTRLLAASLDSSQPHSALRSLTRLLAVSLGSSQSHSAPRSPIRLLVALHSLSRLQQATRNPI